MDSGPIATAVRTFLLDPYSVRDTAISNVADFGNGAQGVCVAANAGLVLGNPKIRSSA